MNVLFVNHENAHLYNYPGRRLQHQPIAVLPTGTSIRSGRFLNMWHGGSTFGPARAGVQPPSTETDERKYSCKTCGRSFKRLEHLHRHESSHGGRASFVCPGCGKDFSRRQANPDPREPHEPLLSSPFLLSYLRRLTLKSESFVEF